MDKQEKKIVRLAVIRDNQTNVCPFGLKIPSACGRAGKNVQNMTAVLRVDDDGFDTLMIKDRHQLAEIVKSNMDVLIWSEDAPQPCVFANYLFEDKPKVECNYGDQAAGIGQTPFLGMPAYTQYFSSGWAAVPIGYYSDHTVRNQQGTFESMMTNSWASDETDKEKMRK